MPTPTEVGSGVQNVLRTGVSGDHPMSYAETPGGLLLLANGIDPMLRWDGLAGSADTAGVAAPLTACELGGVGLGRITGKLVAYQRFIDAEGNTSDLSPVSNLCDCGRDGLIDDINYSTTSGLVTITSFDHELITGDSVLISGVEGLGLVNGSFVVAVVDPNTFTLNHLSITGGIYTQGGTWTMGVANLAYGAVQVPIESKVVRRQILRNLSGNAEVFYVDLDTTDLLSTVFVSTATDDLLCAGEPVPLTYGDDELPFANRNGVPPSHKAVITSHKGRIFAAVDAAYSEGHAEARFNNVSVQGVGTQWRSNFAGRLIYLNGARSAYQIASVDEATQILTLAKPFKEAPKPFALYTILPEPGERRLVYYSEPGLPESWPAYNAIAVPEDNDEIVGLVTYGLYLYILERRHTYRVTFQNDPAQDGYIFLSAQRGSLNDRTYVYADSGLFALDEIGIHKFDGQDSEPISQPIQSVFQQDGTSDIQVDWSADQTLWHAAHDPVRDTIRWFVTMVGFDAPYHAIGYNYRSDRWWIEQYPTAMTASADATIGHRRSLAGTDARRVVCLNEGSYDGVSGVGTLRGNPTSADSTTLTDTSAAFDASEGAPIHIIKGTGRDQERIIASNTATSVTVVEPWGVIPDSTSVYQIGGIAWQWRSGWFRYSDNEEESVRDLEIIFKPLSVPSTLDMTVFYDHSITPRNWYRTIEQDGVELIDGTPQIVVNMAVPIGWARQRMTAHADKYGQTDTFVSVQLSGVQSGDTVRVSQLVIAGAEVM